MPRWAGTPRPLDAALGPHPSPCAGRSQADGDALQELLTKGVLPNIVFRTDDLDATFEKVRASGAEVLQEPIDQPWGPRDCAFRDPSGNTVRISQAPTA